MSTMGCGRFDADEYRARIMKYSDEELIQAGKNCSPASNRWADPMTKMHNEAKYNLCQEEWLRRHRKVRTEDQ